ncbi:MAG: hypothetical protein EBS55_04450 [Flavobacteriaceae bacterium]|nr:hypothetical protein [Flavobacteriaceae bacterium]
MAKQVIALEATLNSGPAEGSVKSLKAQLREAQAEVQTMSDKFGLTSQQAQNAARKAAELKDAIGDAKSLTDAFNPDAKFRAFSSALQGVVGGFAAVQGAMGLFGSQSEEVEQTLLKVQSAMALSQGLNAIGEAGDAFKVLGVKAVEAFNKIRIAIGSIGIGILIAGLGAVASYWDDISDAIFKVDKRQKALKETFEDYKKAATEATKTTTDVKVAFDLARKGIITKEEALKKYNSSLGDALGTAKDLNEAERIFASKTEAYIKSTALRAQADALLKKAAEEKVKQIEEEKNAKEELDKNRGTDLGYLADFIGVTKTIEEKSKKRIKDSQDSANAYTDAAEKILQQAEELEKKNSIKNESEIQSDKETAAEKKKIDEKAAADANTLRDEIIQDNQEQNQLQRQLTQKNYLDSIKDAEFKAKEELRINFENKKKEIEDSKASTKEKNETIALLEQEYNIAKQKLDEDSAKKRAEQQKSTDELIKRNRLESIKDENLKAQEEIENNRKNELAANLEKLNQKLIDEQQFLQNKELINVYYDGLQKDRIDKHNEDLKEKERKQNEDLLKARKAAADASVEITKAETEAKEKLQDSYLNAIGAGLGILKMFGEKNKGLQKALLIAENGLTIARIILDTQRSIVSAKATVAGISPFLPGPVPIPNPKYILAQTIANANIAQSKIAAGIGIAQALAATAKGLSSIGGGGSAGGGGSINAGGNVGGATGGVTAPVAPQLSNTILNQQAINQQGNAAIRTYVVESDVAGNQERIERLNRAARIN